MARKPLTKKVEEKKVIPLNEHTGRCRNCGAGSPFRYAIVKSCFIRVCKTCNLAYDIDNGRIVREGDPAMKWEDSNGKANS